MFCKTNVLRNFVKFTEKQLSQSLFLIKVDRHNVNRHMYFPENFAKFLKTPPVTACEQSTVAIFVGEICSSNNAVLRPDVFCYRLNGMAAPKNDFFHIYISCKT